MCQPDQTPRPGSRSPDPSLPIVVVKTGRTYPELQRRRGDFEDWTVRALGMESAAVEIVDVEPDPHLPPPRSIAGAVVTGSHSMVTEGQGWVEPLADWLRRLVQDEVPILGVCYGHQLLGQTLGGLVGFRPDGPEIGTVAVDLLPAGETDALLGGMPKRFRAHTTHAQSILTLPDGAVLLARTDHETHAAFRAGSCAWGVQFHPEYDQQIMRFYVREQRATLQAQGRDPDRVEAEVCYADTGRILRRFLALVHGSELRKDPLSSERGIIPLGGSGASRGGSSC